MKRKRKNMCLGSSSTTLTQELRVQFSTPLITEIISTVEVNDNISRTELDSHANMAVMGIDCLVVDWITGKTRDALPFDPSIGTSISIPVVGAALAYDYPFTHTTYILMVRNVMYLKRIKHNLIALFTMRAAGGIVDNKPKIHPKNVDQVNHSLFFPDISLRIPLKLKGIFSYFEKRKRICNEVEHCDTTFITPVSIE